MRGFDRKRILLMIFLISFGSAILGLGIAKIGEGQLKYDTDITNPELYPSTVHNLFSYYIQPPSNIVEVITEFYSMDVFSANNTITVKIHVLVNDTNQQDDMIAIPLSSSTDLTGITEKIINNTVQDIQNFKGDKIDLQPNKEVLVLQLGLNDKSPTVIAPNHEYSGSETLKPDNEGQLIYLIIPYKDKKIVNDIVTTKDTPFIIYPSTAKLQFDTNRNIIMQNIETSLSNSRVEGLTLVIIGLVPIGLFMETIIHRFLTDYGKNNST